jgi:3-phenylpropionate/cinnamic acid dioxygenase small subunit
MTLALTSIEDRMAIQELMTRYCCAIDEGDVEGVIACFTQNCRLESNSIGPSPGKGGVNMLAEQMARLRAEGRQFRHIITNFRIETESDRGRIRCYLLDYVTFNGETQLLSPCEYDCDVVRRDGRWLIETRRVHIDRQFVLPGLPNANDLK